MNEINIFDKTKEDLVNAVHNKVEGTGQETPVSTKQDILKELIELRNKGTSWRECSKTLNKPQSSLRYLLSTEKGKVCKDVQDTVQTGVQDKVAQSKGCASVQESDSGVQDVNQLKARFKEELNTLYNILTAQTIQELDKLKGELKENYVNTIELDRLKEGIENLIGNLLNKLVETDIIPLPKEYLTKESFIRTLINESKKTLNKSKEIS